MKMESYLPACIRSPFLWRWLRAGPVLRARIDVLSKVVAAGRFVTTLGARTNKSGGGALRDLQRPGGVFPALRDVFSHRTVEPAERGGKHVFSLAELTRLPAALPESVDR